MGTTLSSLNFGGVGRNRLSDYSNGFIIREINSPWLEALPSSYEDGLDPTGLEKLAKRVTKAEPGSFALLYYYFDDDGFTLTFFTGGKSTAAAKSGASLKKLGNALSAALNDEGVSEALKHTGDCTDPEEMTALIEEAIGTSLMDSADEEPRRVYKNDAVLKKVKARASELKKRPNSFRIVEIRETKWPEKLRIMQNAYDVLKSRVPEDPPLETAVELMSVLDVRSADDHIIPHKEYLAAYWLNSFDAAAGTFVINTDSCEMTEYAYKEFVPQKALWINEKGGLVCIWYSVEKSPSGRGGGLVRPFLACVLPDGTELWRVDPDTSDRRDDRFTSVRTSPDGQITLFFSSSWYYEEKFDAKLIVINGETGEILRTKRIPAQKEFVSEMLWNEEIGKYVYTDRKNKETVLLDADLNETARYPSQSVIKIMPNHLAGRYAFDHVFRQETVNILDLTDGSASRIRLEMYSMPILMTEQGFVGIDEKQSKVFVYDLNGRLVSKHPFKGTVVSAMEENGNIYIVVTDPLSGLSIEELALSRSLSVYRLERI